MHQVAPTSTLQHAASPGWLRLTSHSPVTSPVTVNHSRCPTHTVVRQNAHCTSQHASEHCDHWPQWSMMNGEWSMNRLRRGMRCLLLAVIGRSWFDNRRPVGLCADTVNFFPAKLPPLLAYFLPDAAISPSCRLRSSCCPTHCVPARFVHVILRAGPAPILCSYAWAVLRRAGLPTSPARVRP